MVVESFGRLSPRQLGALGAVALSLFSPGLVAGEGDTLSPFVAATVTHDDNIFRLAPTTDAQALIGTTQRGDSIRVLTAGVGLDKAYGRQRILARISHSKIDYSRFTALGYDTTDSSATWQWRLGNPFSGELGASENTTLTDFGDLRTTDRNLRKQSNAFWRGSYEIGPSWQLTLGTRAAGTKNSQAASTSPNVREQTDDIGVRYLSRPGNTVGIQATRARATYDKIQTGSAPAANNDYTQTDVSGVVNWIYSGQSALAFRAGRTNRRYEQLTQQDFGGATASLGFNWVATGLLNINLTARRELSTSQDQISNTIDRVVSVAPSYAMSGKLSLRGRLERRVRDYSNIPGVVVVNTPKRSDRYRIAGLTLDYNPMRNVQLSLSTQCERRDSNVFGVDYTDRIISASFQYTF